MNSDEADRCLRIGQDHFQKGNFEHALKFFNKSQKLEHRDSTAQLIQRCLDEIKNPKPSTGNSDNHTHQSANFARSQSSDATPGSSSTSAPKSDPIKSQEIRQVLNKKDFYDILGVTKEAKEDEIKKVYRKLALKFHPDKNKEPGADEAFKKIAQAYDCLTNPEKRRKYDEFGNEEPDQHYQHYRQYYNDDISPEDIFGMFFGNAFFQEGPNRRSQQFVYRNQRRQQGGEHRGQQQGQGNANTSKFLPFIQFIPLLIILSFLLFNFQSDDPAYSLSRNSKFHIERKTQYLNVPYYVDHKFTQQYSSKIRAVDESIDRDRTRYLISQCQTNKQRKATLERNAQYYNDERRNRFNDEASKVSLIECDLAKDIQNKFPNLYRAAYYY